MAGFYYCEICGNMLETIYDAKNTPVCCGQPMERLAPASTEGAHEKHIPVCSEKGNILTINVGETSHPMDASHYIEWIGVCTNLGYHRRDLRPGGTPCATFCLAENETVKEVYAYCNIHGLWVAK